MVHIITLRKITFLQNPQENISGKSVDMTCVCSGEEVNNVSTDQRHWFINLISPISFEIKVTLCDLKWLNTSSPQTYYTWRHGSIPCRKYNGICVQNFKLFISIAYCSIYFSSFLGQWFWNEYNGLVISLKVLENYFT